MTNKKKTERRNRYIELKGGVCVHCGSADRLQFDHIDPSTKTVRYLWSLSNERLDAEMPLLQLLCFKCHIKKTAEEYDQYHRSRQHRKSQFKFRPLIHGTHTGRPHYGCKCEPCRLAYNRYDRALRNKDMGYVEMVKLQLKELRASS